MRGPKSCSASIAPIEESTLMTCELSMEMVSHTGLRMIGCRPITIAPRSCAGVTVGGSTRGTPTGMRKEKRLPRPGSLVELPWCRA